MPIALKIGDRLTPKGNYRLLRAEDGDSAPSLATCYSREIAEQIVAAFPPRHAVTPLAPRYFRIDIQCGDGRVSYRVPVAGSTIEDAESARAKAREALAALKDLVDPADPTERTYRFVAVYPHGTFADGDEQEESHD